jgi:hypothetical protein
MPGRREKRHCFPSEVVARAFAFAHATDRWTNRNYYRIVSGSSIVAVYRGKGLLPPKSAAAALETIQPSTEGDVGREALPEAA